MSHQPSSGPQGETPSQFDNFSTWEQLALQHKFVDFLSPQDGFRSCVGSGARWANRTAPGIYFWIAQDGEAYVGQSIVPQSRLRQHMKVHGDLVRVAFLPCRREDLDSQEMRLVREVGKHLPIRNIKHAVSTASEVPFDQVVSSQQQEAFLRGAALPDDQWRELAHLTQVQAHKFQRFGASPQSAEALATLRLFVERAIPRPAATEARFWSATLRARGCFIRVNVGQQEVFTYEFSAGVALVRILTSERVNLIRSARMPYQTPSFVTEMAPPTVDRWLRGQALLSSRALVVQLMRHTQALNSGSHCPQALRGA